MDTKDILMELIRTVPAAAVAVLALIINQKMMDKWVESQKEISKGLGAVLEGLRDLKGK